ncbi:2-succinyl-6-hydroxy-2,4-cyclohexadiene-1-carboxylate synthase [Macrococcus hajekii]|uniref:Putative 2-succinyl-6-hydroxy-2,4-cyclohexadiene-1-carboxylate synthase n=1 Tax=Macrococcus hajekii TaxID=198482 RepID=A0A4R6BLM2_9STAP|nr:2-succinyl-6-hydroxy-2,4-cyclohexadiene-1-carboxylate synthase [Macrococcus hajekii]TDM02598.1 2-succinyl-6-hydroxy-2,4-cyclohexadiene-1-carboxylate synthase [Macrococcus hajekii]GGB02302.1 putative 2-succinyl-6-hydroxy-2,4-cyclohexadiene-1-carboxylate synthase [Macrococcus hajekii]
MHYQLTHNGHDHVMIMLHGFMGDSRAFEQAAGRLSHEMDILRIDLPGHGTDESERSIIWSFDWLIEQLNQLIEPLRQNYKKLTLYGYSMGGRIALYYALNYSVDALILESTSPGLKQSTERQARQHIDEARSVRLETDYQQFVEEWEQLPLFKPAAPLSDTTAAKLHTMRSSQDPQGLAKALRDYGTGSQPDLWPKLSLLTIPVLLLTGRQDEKFKIINQEMAEHLPACQHTEVSAGHSIHVEHPEIFDTIVLEFIKEAYYV